LFYTIQLPQSKQKKSNKKKLFSEDIYTFSPVSLIDVSVLPRHFKFSSLYTRGGLQKNRVLPRPLSGNPFFLSMPGQFSLYKLFWFLPFSPSYSLLFTYFDIVAQMPHFYSSLNLCQIWVVKFTNSLNAKLQKQESWLFTLLHLAFLQGWFRYRLFSTMIKSTIIKDYREPIKKQNVNSRFVIQDLWISILVAWIQTSFPKLSGH